MCYGCLENNTHRMCLIMEHKFSVNDNNNKLILGEKPPKHKIIIHLIYNNNKVLSVGSAIIHLISSTKKNITVQFELPPMDLP